MKPNRLSRRNFLQVTALTVGALSAGSKAIGQVKSASVALIAKRDDPLVSSPPVAWALQELETVLVQKGIKVRRLPGLEKGAICDLYVIATANDTRPVTKLYSQSPLLSTKKAEVNAVIAHQHQGTPALVATGSDARGLMYAILELADQVEHASDPIQTLRMRKSLVEGPFNEVRSVARLFVSDVHDKPWFNDRDMWPAYFSMLAKQRFNRFQLSFGIGFDFLEYVTDSYLLFAYPFLLSVPGYSVRAVNLADEERDHNLEMLRYISAQSVAHGIDFQLGIWTHGYQWAKTPKSNYTIEGITPENHAAYSHDAIATLLKACPNISGVTLRTHGESGVREGSFDFWKTVFQGIAQSGRKVEIDLHTKGLNQTIIDSALATGMPVKLSPKYWAEHMGLPYHQTAIRDLEMPSEDKKNEGFFALSSGARSFTRYGYADFLREDRRYSVMYRIWPGTHRFLLWGDPVSNAAHARAFRFCGSNGVELQEPLSFKGRRGSGIVGDRCGYQDATLIPQHDWEKYLYTYRTWGRLLYNPETDPEVWRRQLSHQFHTNPVDMEDALGAATRIVPLITTAHLPSAANDTFGPEFYVNQPELDGEEYSPYGDTPAPKIFSNASPLDPEIFSRMTDCAAELLKGERGVKYSPLEVAQWLDSLAQKATLALVKAGGPSSQRNPEYRRFYIDVQIQILLGRFFAQKFRSGVLYALHQQSGSRYALQSSLGAYTAARDLWTELVKEVGDVYAPDLTFGPRPYQRGHWRDRLPSMNADIAEMTKRIEAMPAHEEIPANVKVAVEATHRKDVFRAVAPACNHNPPAKFFPGQDLQIVLSAEAVTSILHYRRVNQSERYQAIQMSYKGGRHLGQIPAQYTDSVYPLQYYFELRQEMNAWLYPGLNADLTSQPYFVVRSV